LIKRLFEMEVPEIYDDTVVIKSAVREPGDRAKIAVASNEKDVDPVGACVGMKGSRVQSIIKELRGEKIDIIEWSDEPSVFAANALSPAKVSQVRITDINKRKMEVIVAEDQLSLAIGKKGQNVRLATRLVGWDIDIVSEEKLKKEIALQMGKMMASGEAVPITALEGVLPSQAETLAEKGISDVEALAAMSVDDLVDYLDVSLDEAERILASANAIVEARNQEVDPAAEAEGAEEATGSADTIEASTDDEPSETSAVAEAAEASDEVSVPSEEETVEATADEDSGAEEPEAQTEATADEGSVSAEPESAASPADEAAGEEDAAEDDAIPPVGEDEETESEKKPDDEA
jgi:N utilization substance protein A